jgi:hypothetical protein
MEYFGNGEILKHQRTEFLSSRKCPAEVVLKSCEWPKHPYRSVIAVRNNHREKLRFIIFQEFVIQTHFSKSPPFPPPSPTTPQKVFEDSDWLV